MKTLIQDYSNLTIEEQKTFILKILNGLSKYIEDVDFKPNEHIQLAIKKTTNPEYYNGFLKHISERKEGDLFYEGKCVYLDSVFNIILFNDQVFSVEYYQGIIDGFYDTPEFTNIKHVARFL